MLIYILIFIFGSSIGSFINALVYRLRKNMPIARGARSICPHCFVQLKWYENIPILSFIFLAGKCRSCQRKISWQYPLVETVTAVLFVISFSLAMKQWSNEATVSLFHCFTVVVFYWTTIYFLIVIFLYDLKYYLIPDKISIPAIGTVLFFQLIISFINNNYQLPITNYQLLVFSAIIGGGWFALQFFISKGKWVGGGDIRLGILMGLIVSWPQILTALFLSYVGGAVFAIPLLILKKKTLKSEIPFGVFLVPATIITMFWGERIISWYFSLF